MGSPTANSLKVTNYLEKLKKGSKIHIATLAKELGVNYHVVETQLKNRFKGRFKILEGTNPWYDPKTRLPYTQNGIKFEPKFFQFRNKDRRQMQNRKFWQTQTTKGGATIGEWNVLTEGKKNKKDWSKIYKFKNKEDAVKFYEDYKIKTSGEIGKLRRYLDAEIAKSKGKKLSFDSMKDLQSKAKTAVNHSEVSTLLGSPEYINRVKKFPAKIKFDKPFTDLQRKSLKDAFGGEVKKWDWSYKYGVSPKDNKKLYQRMDSFIRNKDVTWRYKFNWQAPGGWMIQQMDRAAEYYNNPQYKSILEKGGKVIGMNDNGVSYYASRSRAPSDSSKLITSHPHFEQVQKIVDIAAKAKAPLTSQTDKASKALVALFPKGFDASGLSLSRLLAYLHKDKGLMATKNAIQLHHIDPLKALGAATNPENIMLLRKDLNILANTVDQQVRKSNFSRVPELNKAGVRIKVGDVVYGRGTRDPTKLLRQETEALYEPLSKYRPKDWNKLQTWLIDSFKKGALAEARKGGPICNPFRNKGGRVGFADGTSCAVEVSEALENDPKKFAQDVNKTEGVIPKVKNAATRFLQGFKTPGSLKGKIALGAGAVIGGGGAAALVQQFRNDNPNTYLTNDRQMEGMIIADDIERDLEDMGFILDNEGKIELAATGALSASMVKKVYNAARAGEGQLLEMPTELDKEARQLRKLRKAILYRNGRKVKRITETNQQLLRETDDRLRQLSDLAKDTKLRGQELKTIVDSSGNKVQKLVNTGELINPGSSGRIMSALGLRKGVLGLGLNAFMSPAIALPTAAMSVARDIKSGKSTEDTLTNPFTYLPTAFMKSGMKGLAKMGATRGLMGIAGLGLGAVAAAPVVGALSIAGGLATLGSMGYQGYKMFKDRNRTDEDFFN